VQAAQSTSQATRTWCPQKALAAALIAGAPASNTRNRVRDARIGSGREQHVRDPIELDLDCGLLIFEDGEWRLRKSWLHAATAAAAAAASHRWF
jgi:hypothetical protein